MVLVKALLAKVSAIKQFPIIALIVFAPFKQMPEGILLKKSQSIGVRISARVIGSRVQTESLHSFDRRASIALVAG